MRKYIICQFFSGYNAFKLALAQADRTTDLGDSSNSAEPVSSEDSISTIRREDERIDIALDISYYTFSKICRS